MENSTRKRHKALMGTVGNIFLDSMEVIVMGGRSRKSCMKVVTLGEMRESSCVLLSHLSKALPNLPLSILPYTLIWLLQGINLTATCSSNHELRSFFPSASLEREIVSLPMLTTHILVCLPGRTAMFENRQPSPLRTWKVGIGEIWISKQAGHVLGKSCIFSGRGEIPASGRSKNTGSWGARRRWLVVYQEWETLRGPVPSKSDVVWSDWPTASGCRSYSAWPCLTLKVEVFAMVSQLYFLCSAFRDCEEFIFECFTGFSCSGSHDIELSVCGHVSVSAVQARFGWDILIWCWIWER